MGESMQVVCLPGDNIADAEEAAKTKKVILGPGIRELNKKVICCKAGILKEKKSSKFWIDHYQKRYVPIRGDAVVGVITQKSGDIFRVDIGAHETACLSYLAFEGATKKMRPDINPGDLLYAKLIVASPDLESELTCVNSQGKKGKLGVLADGFVFNCSISLVRRILNEKCPLIRALKTEMPFEIAAGMNGRIWIKGKTVRETIALGNAILATEFSSDGDIKEICNNIGNILFT